LTQNSLSLETRQELLFRTLTEHESITATMTIIVDTEVLLLLPQPLLIPSESPPRLLHLPYLHLHEMFPLKMDTRICSDSDSECNSVILPLHQQQQEQPEASEEVRFLRSISSHKPRILARHRPSLSLVDLAKSAAMDDSNSKIVLFPKRHSAPVSPVSTSLDPERYAGGVVTSSPSPDLLSPGMETPASEPWGHFVDMTLSECHQLRISKAIPISPRHSSSSVKADTRKRRQRRRKHANPYGEYHTSPRHNRCPLRFLPTGATSKSDPRFDVAPLEPTSTRFQLQLMPRKESTDQISGDLERLHFR